MRARDGDKGRVFVVMRLHTHIHKVWVDINHPAQHGAWMVGWVVREEDEGKEQEQEQAGRASAGRAYHVGRDALELG